MTEEELALVRQKFASLSGDPEFAPIAEVVRRLLEEIGRLKAENARLREACLEAANALLDYVIEKEQRGDVCGYGHSVLRRIEAALKGVEPTPGSPRPVEGKEENP